VFFCRVKPAAEFLCWACATEVDVTDIALFLFDEVNGDEDDILTIDVGNEVVLTAEAAGTVVLDVSVSGAQLSLTIMVTDS